MWMIMKGEWWRRWIWKSTYEEFFTKSEISRYETLMIQTTSHGNRNIKRKWVRRLTLGESVVVYTEDVLLLERISFLGVQDNASDWWAVRKIERRQIVTPICRTYVMKLMSMQIEMNQRICTREYGPLLTDSPPQHRLLRLHKMKQWPKKAWFLKLGRNITSHCWGSTSELLYRNGTYKWRNGT